MKRPSKSEEEQPRKRGRPELKITNVMRRNVEQARALGMSEDDVAMAIGCSTNTLRKHFRYELRVGHAKRRFELIKLSFAEARRGNASMLRKLLDESLVEQVPSPSEMSEVAHSATEDGAAPTLKPVAQGKKERANDLAHSAHVGTRWQHLIDPDKTPKN